MRRNLGIDPAHSVHVQEHGYATRFWDITRENSLGTAYQMLAAFGRQRGDWVASQRDWVTSLDAARTQYLVFQRATTAGHADAAQQAEHLMRNHLRDALFLAAANNVFGFSEAPPHSNDELDRFVASVQFQHLVTRVNEVYPLLLGERDNAERSGIRFAQSPGPSM